MTTREHAPDGAPCWADLWTSDVEGAQRFYAHLFGWQADAPDPAHGGYFMFNRQGVPVAGGMGPIPGMVPDNRWKPYLATSDVAGTARAVGAHGGKVMVEAMAVDEAGTQGVITDPGGAALGVWQANQFPGFTVIEEPGTPSWFELHTRDFDASVEFYRTVFGWTAEPMTQPGFRYAVMQDSEGHMVAGVFDAAEHLAPGTPAQWSIYWMTDDVDRSLALVGEGGGSVVTGAEDTPYGRMATVSDPTGATFRLHTPNR